MFGRVFPPFFFSSLSSLTAGYTFSFCTPARARNSRVFSSAELAERARTTCHRRLLCLSSPFVPSPLTCIATGAADIWDLMLHPACSLRCMQLKGRSLCWPWSHRTVTVGRTSQPPELMEYFLFSISSDYEKSALRIHFICVWQVKKKKRCNSVTPGRC